MNDQTVVDSRLHTAWLSQLVREYRDICFQHRINLQLPTLTISRSHTQLGSWNKEGRVLSLSHFLISGQPWSVTLQVLRHEMAHQLCCELYGAEEAGHGPFFRKACLQLGVLSPFQRASADLAASLPQEEPGSACTEPGRRVIEKVRKLLALAHSDNEHEAALAMQRARAMLDRYRLDFDSLAAEQQMVHRTLNTKGRTLPTYRKIIGGLLESEFGVRVVCATLYDPASDTLFKTLEIMGPAENVAIAEHCYYFLENRLQTLWMQNRERFGSGARASYFLGVLAGFKETLQKTRRSGAADQWENVEAQERLPAVQEQQRLDTFVATCYPRLSRRRGRPLSLHGQAYREAVAAGRKLTLQKPVVSGQRLRLPR